MCRRAGEGPASQRIVGLLEASLGGVTLASVASARISSGDGSGARWFTGNQSRCYNRGRSTYANDLLPIIGVVSRTYLSQGA